ncbi:MAG: hypothetical protein R3D31_18100 [Hyphomicrobiaceae bacterium]
MGARGESTEFYHYPGEMLAEAAGFPALSWFRPGEAGRPLVVFVPGAHHLARIAYGGHDGARAEDFLAHWLAERGFPFLAASYPVATPRAAMPGPFPAFTARDWGRQVAALARRTVEAHGLAPRLVVLVWSMAGKIAQSVHEAAREAGLAVDLVVGFAATPGIPGIPAWSQEFRMAPSGYVTRPEIYADWDRQLDEVEATERRVVLPREVFLSEYVGDFPVSLYGYGQIYRDGRFVRDHMAQAMDIKSFAFDDFPVMGTLTPSGRLDARHALTDRAVWGLYNIQTVVQRLVRASGCRLDDLPEAAWRRLVALSDALPERLCLRMPGNHFFFVGETGARATAAAVATLITRAKAVEAEVAACLAGVGA